MYLVTVTLLLLHRDQSSKQYCASSKAFETTCKINLSTLGLNLQTDLQPYICHTLNAIQSAGQQIQMRPLEDYQISGVLPPAKMRFEKRCIYSCGVAMLNKGNVSRSTDCTGEGGKHTQEDTSS